MPCHGIWKLGRPHCNGAECPNQPEFNSQHNTSDSKHSTERPTKEQRAFQCNPSSDLPCMFLVVTCECRSLSLSLLHTDTDTDTQTHPKQIVEHACLAPICSRICLGVPLLCPIHGYLFLLHINASNAANIETTHNSLK